MKKLLKVTSIALALALTLSVSGCGKNENVVATVNGDEISRQELDMYLDKMKEVYKQQGADFNSEEGKKMLKSLESTVLDKLIEEKVVMHEAENQKLVPSDKEVDKEIQSYQSRFKSKEEFEQVLKSFNWTLDVYKEKVKFGKAKEQLQEKITKDIKVSDEEVKNYFETNKESFKEPEQVRARHILIRFDSADNPSGEKVNRTEAEAKKIAEGVLKEAKAGADFAKLSSEKSEDPGSKNNGGEYTFRRGQMVPEFEAAAFGLKPGQITKDLVKTSYGFHIIKLEEKIPAKEKTFAEVKDEISQGLVKEKKEKAFNDFVEKLMKEAKIDRKIPKAETPAPGMGGGMGGASGSNDSAGKPAGHP